MNTLKIGGSAWRKMVAMCVVLLFTLRLSAAQQEEKTYPVLQIGTQTFTNATVTTRASNYVFIVHSGGLANVKVTGLPDETRVLLGYPSLEDTHKRSMTNAVTEWAKGTLANVKSSEELKTFERTWAARIPAEFRSPAALTPTTLIMLAAVSLAVHLFFSFCCLLICRKAGTEPGILIWLPVLQLIPMLRAAGMSAAWFFAFLVPVLNVVAQILWFVKIVEARGKSPWLVLGLLLPGLNLLAFLYLAFSEGVRTEEPRRGPRLMTLEAV